MVYVLLRSRIASEGSITVYDAIKSGLKAYSSRLYIARSRQITVYDAIKSGLKA